LVSDALYSHFFLVSPVPSLVFFYACILLFSLFFLIILRTPRSTLFPYTTLFRSSGGKSLSDVCRKVREQETDGSSGKPSGGLSRSEEHTSELQSRFDLVCRLLLEKKKT